MRSSPRFTSGEVKPTMRTNVLLHASRVERSNLPSGLAFFSTLYGLRFTTDWEVKPTMRTSVPLHAFRTCDAWRRSNLPSEHVFFSTLYGLRGQTYHRDERRVERHQDMRSSPRFTGREVKPTIKTRIPLHALRLRFKPTIRTCFLLHALRIERSNLPWRHAFFSTLYGLRGKTYHQEMCSSPRFTGWGQTYHQDTHSSQRFTDWEVKPTIRTRIPLYALRIERSNLPLGHAFLSTLYGLRGQTYHQDTRSSPRFTGWGQTYHQDTHSSPRFTDWEVKPTIRTRIPLHALRVEVKPTIRTRVPLHALPVERSILPSGQAFFSTLYGLRGQTYHQDMCSSPRFTDWGQTYHQDTHSFPRFTGWGQTHHQDTRFSPHFTGWGQTYHQDTHSSPRFTGWG